MDAIAVGFVAPFAVLPRHSRVVPELIKPSTNQRVAALDLVVEKTEGQIAFHCFNPQRQAAKLHS